MFIQRTYPNSYPSILFVPDAPNAGSYHLIVHISGDGEKGPGTFDANLTTVSPTNTLALVFNHGPLQLIKAGVTYYETNKVIVCSPQAPGSYGTANIRALISALKKEFNISDTTLVGMSLGGAPVWNLAYSVDTDLTAIGPIAAAVSPTQPASGSINYATQFAGLRIWCAQYGDDNQVTSSWMLGSVTPFTPVWYGWLTAITGVNPLDSHPDKPTSLAHGASGPKVVGVKNLYTGSFANGAWTWTPGIVASSLINVTVFPKSGHGGWDEMYGTDVSSFNQVYWDWLLKINTAAPIVIPPVVTYTQAQVDALNAQIATLQSQVSALNLSGTNKDTQLASKQVYIEMLLTGDINKDAQIASLQDMVASASSQIASEQTQMATMGATIAQYQSLITNAKNILADTIANIQALNVPSSPT